MRVRTASALGGLLLGGVVTLGVAAPAQAAPCDAYSQTCPSQPPTIIGGGGGQPATGPTSAPGGGTPVAGTPTTPAEGRTLPFTGAELVLMSMVGVGGIAGGTALVVAGRRRRAAV